MKTGIICDLGFSKTICFSNYYYAMRNIFGNTKIINNTQDLENIDLVFIGNDHFGPHSNIWNQDEFISTCNEKDIKVCVYTAEHIHSSNHPWNIQIQQRLEGFKNLYQRVLDVDDAIKLNKKIARCACSKYYEGKISVPERKINKCVFVGAAYSNRTQLIKEIENKIDLVAFDSLNNSWEDYMSIIARYRFVLSPYSHTSNSMHLKFYECFLVNSIPVHQIYDNTLEYYPIEGGYDDVIYFKEGHELPEKIKNFSLQQSYHKPWLEDVLLEFFRESDITVPNDNQ